MKSRAASVPGPHPTDRRLCTVKTVLAVDLFGASRRRDYRAPQRW